MRIAVDVMGGDHAPGAVLDGAQRALQREPNLELDLVGAEAVLGPGMQEWTPDLQPRVRIVDAKQVVAMDDHPGQALRSKQDSSLVVAARRTGQGQCAGFVSAGNTGAAMAAALHYQGRIAGVYRPAIASPIPTVQGVSLLLDAGANVDARPAFLPQYAVMGSVYAEMVLGLARPRVALLNIGAEKEKGNEFSRQAHQLLQEAPVAFVGNIEGRDVPYGRADVILCDGFVGNVVLKLAEGLSMALLERLRDEIGKTLPTRLGAVLCRPAFSKVKQTLDYRKYGGAPLLGVKGLCIIAHGSSDAEAVANAIMVAVSGARQGLAEEIARRMQLITGG